LGHTGAEINTSSNRTPGNRMKFCPYYQLTCWDRYYLF